ncbi:MAG: hypothetical protein GWN99_00345 [Gemmatimonadetes bacterium]|uniref:Uncharacterized protein n=1 Tax=Candidatus Kutchimonas denitrificans TaxID=3056748 RepID=A0AAE4Z6D4_9BACT|nr:hypothetical protein [Gemmatimonadota bacterium]NIR73557.1 hypothetical protein [Candidatus Kutchimonas denitrificans]NIR99516.1 hypothetical protein [Gemmatimonadota bacterium]NIT65136.1 hypothetical protein [Gemmatimonadota bacterium]NIV23669.1 hypothetical protein [Gemmatimonadota bacterium]
MKERPGSRIFVDLLFVSALLVAALLLVYQGAAMVTSRFGTAEASDGTPFTEVQADTLEGLRFRLSEGEPGDEVSVIPRPETEALSDARVADLLTTLPPLPPEDEAGRPVALTDEIPPPPRTGRTVRGQFPPEEELSRPGPTEIGPVEVVRYAPEGAVERARELAITFNHPMVPVTSHEILSARQVPVRLRPRPEGRWRWVGTRTLVFEVDEGFPMATLYRAELRAGVESASGAELSEPLRWSFRTPPPGLVHSHPRRGPVGLEPIIFLAFDQRIDADAVLSRLVVSAGSGPLPTRRATAAEIEADDAVKRLTEATPEGRWLAARIVDPLPVNSAVQVRIPPGTPSAEGPLTTDTAQAFDFRTYGPLRVVRAQCHGNCEPGTAWRIEFSNPLDAESIDSSMVSVEPRLPNLRVAASYRVLSISGRSRPRTRYRVTLKPGIRDWFGQSLDHESTLTINVGPYPKVLNAAGGNLVVLDPAAPRELTVQSVNHPTLRVRLYRVEPRHWSDFLNSARYRWRADPPGPPGRLVHDQEVVIDAGPDEIAATRIDLGPALDDGLGHVIVDVEPGEPPLDGRRPQRILKWVQATRLGLSVVRDHRSVIAWVTSLEGAAPISGAEVRFVDGAVRRRTDEMGLAALPQPGRNRIAATLVLVARRGDDVAFLPAGRWVMAAPDDRHVIHAFTDRPLYRPGETVHFKGWVRKIGGGPRGDLSLPSSRWDEIEYQAVDPRGNDVARGSVNLNDLFGFDGAFPLPGDVALGPVRIELRRAGIPAERAAIHRVHFQVQEFRRPEYEVSVTHDGGPHFVGGAALVTARATYFAGGGLPGSDVNWRVTSRPASYSPPGWDEFTFGRTRLWPFFEPYRSDRDDVRVEEFDGRTNVDGEHHLRVEFLEAVPPVAMSLQAVATVQDVNRQTWTESTDLLVHPGGLYVGLRSARRFVRVGQALVLEAVAVTPEGEPVAGRELELTAVQTRWSWRRGTWVSEEGEPQACQVVSETEPVRCEFRARRGGAYRISATVRDDQGRPSLTELTVWAAGGAGRTGPDRGIQLIADRDEYQPGDTAEILVQSPYDPAEGIVTLRREGLVRTERFRVDGTTHVLRVPILEEYIPNLHVNVELIAAAPAEPSGKLPPDPNLAASQQLDLEIPPLARVLRLTAVPRQRQLKPGGETVIDLRLLDAAGTAIENADVAVAVIDEAVLALLPRELQNPVETFYPARGDGVTDYQMRGFVLLGPRVDTTATGSAALRGTVRDAQTGRTLEGVQVYLAGTRRGTLSGADGGYVLSDIQPGVYTVVAEYLGFGQALERLALEAGTTIEVDFALAPDALALEEMRVAEPAMAMEAAAAPADRAAAPEIRLRADFAALAVFAGSVRTDDQGRASVPVRLPDNLTRYRVIAVAAGGPKRFGKGESTITASLPLMARPSPPRFLNFGDKLELPVLIQNRESAPVSVDVAVRAANLTLTGEFGQRVEVPGQSRVEVRFPARTVRPGTAHLQVAAATAEHGDAAEMSLPVWTPATTEAFATYGEVDQGAVVIPVEAPRDVIDEYGGLEITTSSTALQALTDALLYLTSYPYACAEQIASRIIAIAALRDVLGAFEAEGLPEPEVLVAAVERDIKRLASMQNGDGGFSFWGVPGQASWPYVSIHVTHALVRAREKGFTVPEELLGRAQRYLNDIEDRIPARYSMRTRRALQAYALYTLALTGGADVAKARAIVSDGGLQTLPLEAAGWLLSVLADAPLEYRDDAAALRRFLGNRASETAATAQFTTDYGGEDYLLLYSRRRVDAVILDALIADQPESDLIPKLVRGLLAHRTRGRWGNTQENSFVLLALDRYFATYERTPPNFIARLWLGDDYAGGHEFRGRTTERHQIEVPMAWLTASEDTNPLILGKDGPGRLYYRVGMRYAPSDLLLDAAEHGFGVERVYEAVDDPDDVTRDDRGNWVIRAGARVRVKLSMAAPARRYHVALVDPLPAAFEALNPDLAGQQTQDAEVTPGVSFGAGWYYWWRWYEHQNLRDERAEVFTSLLPAGVYTYSYLARATTPGSFMVPPPRAEEMYHPETFGRGPSERVIVPE